jgi:hypothetical protein
MIIPKDGCSSYAAVGYDSDIVTSIVLTVRLGNCTLPHYLLSAPAPEYQQ